MTPWYEQPLAAGTAGTHALVIGTSYYDFLPKTPEEPSPADRETFGLRQVRTPATSAWKFANWLKSSYNNPDAPLASIRLLLSPSDWEKAEFPELAALPAEVLPATRDNVAKAVDEWHDAAATNAENVAVLYASGHGIQLNKEEGGIVLLQDFATRNNSPLDHSLDVGGVRKGMAGATMAQQQFYFVDACEVRPPQAVNYQSLGQGVSLRNPFEGAPLVSAVYFSAAPSTEALGEAGEGTLFVQALLECLELTAVDHHVHENEWWVVTTLTLSRALQHRVAELARALGREQTAVPGGQMVDVIFHVLPEPPKVPVTLELDPEDAAACAVARLWDGIGPGSIFDKERFTPVLSKSVPAGQYVLTVRIKPPTKPYKGVKALPIPALPPGFRRKVPVV